MGCQTSRHTPDISGFDLYTRPDTPSIYSVHDRAAPSHSRSTSRSRDQDPSRPLLRSKFSDTFYPTGQNGSLVGFFSSKNKANKSATVAVRAPPVEEKVIPICNHSGQREWPCFACLREKPKPRRHRSRRNAHVLIPRNSYHGGGGGARQRSPSPSSSLEMPMQQHQREDLPPWVTTRHGVLVPATAAQELNESIIRHERTEGRSFQSFRPSGESTVVGGYTLSPEVYYASLPLPDLPADDARSPRSPRSDYGATSIGRGRAAAWI